MSGIRVELELDDGTFTTRMIHAGETVSQFNKNVGQGYTSIKNLEGGTRTFLQTMRDVTVTIGLAGRAINNIRAVSTGWMNDIVKVNAEFERMTKLMQSMSRSGDTLGEATTQVMMLRDMAKQVPYSLQAITDAYVKLKTTGVEPTRQMMQGLVDAVAASGGTEEQLKHAALALSQMAGKGVVQMEELRQQLGEAVPRAAELMARSMGVSYNELIAAVGKGTVDAKQALALLGPELQRTFGGAAAEQMNTYNGLLKQLNSSFQTLAVNVGEAGFFKAVKEQLADLNTLVGSNAGNVIAKMLGSGLTSVIETLRKTTETFVSMRHEVLAVGEAMALTFGLSAAGGLINGFAARVSQLRAEITLLSTSQQVAATASNWANFSASWNAANTSVGLFRAGVALVPPVVGSVRIAIQGLLMTVTTMAPYLMILAGVVAFVATNFDLFGSKTKSAWEELKTFGATSREALKLPAEDLRKQADALEDLERRYAAAVAVRERLKNSRRADPTSLNQEQSRSERIADELNSQVVAARAKLRGDQKVLEEQVAAVEIDEAKRVSEAKMRLINDQVAAKQRALDLEGKSLQDERSVAIQEAIKAGKATDGIKEDYTKREKQRQLSYYEFVIDLMQKEYEAQKAAAGGLSGVDLTANEMTRQSLLKQIEVQRDLQEQALKLTTGVPVIQKDVDLPTLLKRGQQALQNMKGDIEGNKAELAGASNEAAKLVYLLQQGKYGPADAKQVQELTQALIEAQKEKEKLDDLLKGKKDAERDLNNVIINTEQKILELRTQGLSELDKFDLKMKNGAYGPGIKSMDDLARLNQKVRETGTQAEAVRKTVADGLFSPQVQSQANTFLSIVEKIGGVFSRMADSAGRVQLPNLNGAAAGGNFVASTGSGGLVDRIIGGESGGNASIKNPNSTATGLGQFIESTWLKFLGEMHPELLQSKAVVLQARSNPELSREAVGWYARQNASFLTANGQQPTDANLYMAHLLGPQGALTVLTNSIMTPLKDILSASVMRANPNFQGKDGAWMRQFAAGIGGSGSSFMMTGGVDGATLQANEVLQQRQKALDLQKQLDAETAKAAKNDMFKDLIADANKAQDQIDGVMTREAKLRREISRSDKLQNKDPDSPEYKDLLAQARKLDEIEAKLKRVQKARNAAAGVPDRLEQMKGDEQARMEDAQRQLADPTGIKFDAGYWALKRSLDKMVQSYRDAGKDTVDIEADTQSQLQSYQNRRVTEFFAAERLKSVEAQKSALTEREANALTTQLQIDKIRAMLETFQGSEEEKVKYTALANERIAALQEELARKNQSAVAKMIRDWKDVGKGIDDVAGTAFNGFADTMADFVVTGKNNFKQLADSILKDLARVAIRWAMSGLGSAAGLGGGSKAGATGGASKLLGSGGGSKAGAGAVAGIAHTGGILGRTNLSSRLIHPSIFAGAPKFHTGGIVGGLGKDEMPIIAKRKEGVFTPEQMKAMGGQVITIAPAITINASGGTNAQNQDLAKQMSDKLEPMLRGLVVDEVLKQRRPGNALNR